MSKQTKSSERGKDCPQSFGSRCSLDQVACVVLATADVDDITVLPETRKNARVTQWYLFSVHFCNQQL